MEQTFAGNAEELGAIQYLMAKTWGSGLTSPGFWAAMENQVRAVMNRLTAFGTPISAEEFRGALQRELRGHSSLDSPRLFNVVHEMNVLGILSTCSMHDVPPLT